MRIARLSGKPVDAGESRERHVRFFHPLPPTVDFRVEEGSRTAKVTRIVLFD